MDVEKLITEVSLTPWDGNKHIFGMPLTSNTVTGYSQRHNGKGYVKRLVFLVSLFA